MSPNFVSRSDERFKGSAPFDKLLVVVCISETLSEMNLVASLKQVPGEQKPNVWTVVVQVQP